MNAWIDFAESRFGAYRQLNGGNYWVSVARVFAGERATCLASAVKHFGIHPADLKPLLEAGPSDPDEVQRTFDLIYRDRVGSGTRLVPESAGPPAVRAAAAVSWGGLARGVSESGHSTDQ